MELKDPCQLWYCAFNDALIIVIWAGKSYLYLVGDSPLDSFFSTQSPAKVLVAPTLLEENFDMGEDFYA